MRRLIHCTLPPDLVHRPILHDLVRATTAVVNVRRANVDVESGVLCASGFVAGEGLAGVMIAGYAYATNQGRRAADPYSAVEGCLALAVFAVAVVVLARSTRKVV